jgi:alcohol dehydrogenase
VTASTGLDAVSHAVESFVTKAATSASRELSKDAWRRVSGNLVRVLESPSDIVARGEMLLGASLAGAAIEHSMLGAAHSAANPISARRDIPHGLAVAILLPHVVRYNEPVASEDYRELLRAAGHPESDADRPGSTLARWLEELLASTGLPGRLREVDFPRDAIEDAAGEAEGQWTARFNPRPLTAADFRALYASAF